MSPLRRWRGEQSPAPNQDPSIYTDDDPRLSVEGFLESQTEALLASRSLWATVGDTFEQLSDPKGAFMEAVAEGIEYYAADQARQHSMTKQEERDLSQRLQAVSLKLPNDFGPFLFTAVSSSAVHNKGSIRESFNLLRQIRKVPDTLTTSLLHYVITNKPNQFGVVATELPERIKKANQCRDHVAGDLARAITIKPSLMAELGEMNGNGSSELLDELKRVCGVDWYYDPGKSHLRRVVNRLRDDEEIHLAGFIDAVETSDDGGKLGRIKEMSRFALAAMGVDIDNPDIRKILQDTRKHWTEFEIDKAFNEYRKTKALELERSVAVFVGSEHEIRRNIRFPRSLQDVEVARARFNGYFDGSRAVRRQGRHFARQAHLTSSIDMHEIIKQGQASRIEKHEPLTLMMTKRTEKGHIIVPVKLGDFLKDFEDQAALRGDIERMITEITTDPRGLGTENLSKHYQIKIDGRPLRLRRFSPLKRPGFHASPEAKGMRVVYGITNGSVVVVEVIRRDEFAEKYG